MDVMGRNSKLTLSNGRILAKKENAVAVEIGRGSSASYKAEFEMKGGKVYAADGFAVTDALKGYAVTIRNGTAKFTNGELAGKVGIEVSYSGVVSSIDGITVNATEYAIYNNGIIGSTTTDGIKGGTFNVKATEDYAQINGIYNFGFETATYIKMTGGNFSLDHAGFNGVRMLSIDNAGDATGDITGGSFVTTQTDNRSTRGITIGSGVTFSSN